MLGREPIEARTSTENEPSQSLHLILSTVLCSSGGTHAAARNGVRDLAVQEVSIVEDVLDPTSDGQAAFGLASRTCDIDAGE